MRTYEELTGASGRQIYYRAERYLACDLFRKITPDVEVDGSALVLNDLSMSGLAAIVGNEQACVPEEGSEVSVQLLLDNEVLFEARARVCRTEEIPVGHKVGLGFTSGTLDISDVVRRQKELAARRELDGWLSSDLARVPAAYRAFVSDVVYFFRRYKSVFDRLEPKTNGHAAPGSTQIADVLGECESRGLPEWRELWYRGNQLVKPLAPDPDAQRAAKRLTEMLVTPEVVAAPFCNRAFRKPLGYPGDYELMNHVYAWHAQGDSGYAKFVHRLGVHTAECVATRMIMARDSIVDIVEAGSNGQQPIRIASLGAGPAQEIVNFLEGGIPAQPIEFTLIDQDRSALSYAYERIYPHTLHPGARVSVKCLNVSFAQLMTDPKLFDTLAPQDMIYCVGLIDYLAARRAARLVANLYARVAPGGRLLIGSMRDSDVSPHWPMEYICDWSLQYRSERDMHFLGQGLDAADKRIDIDPTQHVYMLQLQRRSGVN